MSNNRWRHPFTAPKDGSEFEALGRIDVYHEYLLSHKARWLESHQCFANRKGDVLLLRGWRPFLKKGTKG